MVSDLLRLVRTDLLLSSLNPCSNGIWSLTLGGREVHPLCRVLILVLMEYGL